MTELDWTPAVTRGESALFRNGARHPERDRSFGSRTIHPHVQPRRGALERLGDTALAMLLLSGSAGLVLTAAAISHTYGRRSASLADAEDRQWDARNRRRIYLIDRDLAGALGESDRQELDELEKSMAAELNATAPLPFDRLAELEKRLDDARL